MGALLLALGAWFVLDACWSFSVKVMGLRRAQRFAGFSPAFVTFMVLGISGAAAGVAGMVEVSANIGQLQLISPLAGGFTAIIVAFLARLNPLAVIGAGLVVALAELVVIWRRLRLAYPKL